MNLEKDRVYAAHILECIDKINHYTKKDKQQFIGDDLVQDGVLRRLQTMAESTQRLSDELKQTAPDVDWRAFDQHPRLCSCQTITAGQECTGLSVGYGSRGQAK
jgi:uncharacterized protein with HEPN domain